MAKKRKIGIMGGTFYPIHIAHLFLGEQAYEQFHLDSVWFMPSSQPPHKPEQKVSDAAHRGNMVKLAIADNPHFSYSELELHRSGKTYTSDTLMTLVNTYPETEFYFIMGADSLNALESWHRPEIILQSAIILAAVRGDDDTNDVQMQITKLKQQYGGDIRLLCSPDLELSSTELRKRLDRHQCVRYLIPDRVIAYIEKNHLYKKDMIV